MRNATLIEKARPNGFYVALWADNDGECWYVEECTSDDYDQEPYDFETLAEAKACFDALCKELRDTPNWEAQARYDEEHGTDNGYAPHQYGREE